MKQKKKIICQSQHPKFGHFTVVDPGFARRVSQLQRRVTYYLAKIFAESYMKLNKLDREGDTHLCVSSTVHDGILRSTPGAISTLRLTANMAADPHYFFKERLESSSCHNVQHTGTLTNKANFGARLYYTELATFYEALGNYNITVCLLKANGCVKTRDNLKLQAKPKRSSGNTHRLPT